VDKLQSIIEKAFSRRKFVVGAGGVAAATMIGGLAGCGSSSSSGGGSTPTPPGGFTDSDVLNFALNLEYLEAQFYLYAATGSGLAASDTAAPSGYTGTFSQGTVTVGSAAKVPGLTAQQQDILNEIAYEEQEHVRFLRTTLGSAATPMPSIDLSFFGPLAVAAGVAGPTFNPFSSFDYFLVGAFIFEDVGVTAYAGAAPLITPTGVAAGYLTAASGILAVEAYHAAYIRTAITAGAIAAGSAAAFPYITVANQVAALRATLTVGNSGAPGTATGNTGAPDSSTSVETALALPANTTTASSIVAADPTNALGFARDVNQVHHIVYGSATVGVASGGFFPNGTNSIFAKTTA
jgi:Ferritin-like domain